MEIELGVIEGGLPGKLMTATKLCRLDAEGNGGAHHKYAVTSRDGKELFCGVDFQDGGIAEVGVNGCQNEDLLKIVIDRLECFQLGKFACEENEAALKACHVAMLAMNMRTEGRVARGVEGKEEA
jgi:hypothetical protein